MSDFALSFIPEEPGQTMTARERIDAARRGELAVSPEREAAAAAADAEAVKLMTPTSIIDQALSGVNEGVAQFAGFPVDMTTLALNAGISGVNKLAGTEFAPITDPVGGSQDMTGLMAPFISEVDPQGAGQRYARRIGQEVGFGVPASATMAAVGPLAAAAQSNLPVFMAGNALSDVAAGAAGATSREIAPESDTADLLATVLAGGASAAGFDAAMRTPPPPAPTRADRAAETSRLYGAVQDVEITPSARDRLVQMLQARMADEGGDPGSYPLSGSQVRRVERFPKPTIGAVDVARRRIRDHVARSANEGAMGGALMEEVDKYLATLAPGDVVAADPQEVLETLLKARASAHTGIKADEIADAISMARSATESSGTAGNALNNQTRTIGKMYDDETLLRRTGKRRGFTDDELAAMEKIVRPSTWERTLQRVGRFAPTTGNLQATMGLLGGGGPLVSLATGNPAYAMTAAPSMMGVIAQALAERAKSGHLDKLMDTTLRGGVAASSTPSDAARAAIVSALLTPQLAGPQ